MTTTEESVNVLKTKLIDIADHVNALLKQGVKVEFQITDGKLVTFKAWQEMK